ncbi:hypothetical protein [Listeria rocourtiae]|uniref:hypothetical protein n=1 Tax=Listeria rocourtiae TaxID=647910 RepID=UPI003D2F753D
MLEGLFQKEKQWPVKKIARVEYRNEHIIKSKINKLHTHLANYLFSGNLAWNASGKERYLERIIIYMYAHPSYSHAQIAKHYKMTEEQVASIIAWDKELAYVRDKYAMLEMDIVAHKIMVYHENYPEASTATVYAAVCQKGVTWDEFQRILGLRHNLK